MVRTNFETKYHFCNVLPLILWPIYNRNCHLPLANMQKKTTICTKADSFFMFGLEKWRNFCGCSIHFIHFSSSGSSYDLSVYVVDFSWTLMTCVFGSKTVLTSIIEQIMEFLSGWTKIKWQGFDRFKVSNQQKRPTFRKLMYLMIRL